MKFSTQEEYGLRCIIAIAKNGDGTDLTIPKIAKIESLSEPHVAKLLMILRKTGFVRSTRGHTGGYSLSMPAEKIVVGEVLAALGGRIYEPGFCDRHSGLVTSCVHESSCYLGPLWLELQKAIDHVLAELTLADLLKRQPTPSPLKIQVKRTRAPRKRAAVAVS
jgi:Rrf2 family protein